MVGSGLYCDGSVGAAVATGDGEEIMRTCACFLVVESMRNGMDVQDACALAVHRITSLKAPKRKDDALVVGIVAMDKHGKVSTLSLYFWFSSFPHHTCPVDWRCIKSM